jgi:hypothetical protein
MKRLTIFMMCLCWLGANATSWRVNSDPQINAHFVSLQDAIYSLQVQPGDTLYLENGSSFGTTTIDKQLIIIGPGYFLYENDSTYANPLPAMIQTVYFASGSAGTKLIGVQVLNGIDLYSDDAINITIERSYVAGNVTTSYYITGLTIRQSYINGYINSVSLLSSNIYNNIITKGINLSATTGGHNIYNNVFYVNENYYFYAIQVKNSNFANNIIIREPAGWEEYCIDFVSSTNSSFIRNIMNQSPNPSFPDNLYEVGLDSIFVAAGSTDSRFKLKEGSPAIGYAVNGQDAGVFSGYMPYILSGLPYLVPRIIEAVIPASGSNNQIPVHLKIKMQEE